MGNCLLDICIWRFQTPQNHVFEVQHHPSPHIHTQLPNQFFFCVPILAKGIMNWTYVSLPRLGCWSLIPSVMAFGGGALGGNLVWMRSCGWVPPNGAGALVRGWRAQSSASCEDSVRKMVICKAGNEISPDTKSVSTLILDLKTPELWEINICWLSHQVYGVFVITAPTDKNQSIYLVAQMGNPRIIFDSFLSFLLNSVDGYSQILLESVYLFSFLLPPSGQHSGHA